jgi:Holliday junction resolvasome RuvABC endonuclease subunit
VRDTWERVPHEVKTIGVDLGIHKIAWSVWEDDVLKHTDAWVSTRPLRHEELTELGSIFSGVIAMHEPDQIFIEDTMIGNNRKYSIQLSQTMGAILSACGLATQIHTMVGKDIPVIPVNNKTWKREVIGNGNAAKDMVRFWLDDVSNAYSVLCGNDQDRFDAAAIGYYGYVISRRAEGLAKSGFPHSGLGT